jgi:formiminotetrahydrofolate cyclodeaminase
MEGLGIKGQALKSWYLDAVDRDTDSFNLIMDAMKLPKETESQKLTRAAAIETANKEATLVPLSVLEKSLEVLPILEGAAQRGNPNCASDAGVGAYCLSTCAHGAALNVRINLKGIKDSAFIQDCQERLKKALSQIDDRCREIIVAVNRHIDG